MESVSAADDKKGSGVPDEAVVSGRPAAVGFPVVPGF